MKKQNINKIVYIFLFFLLFVNSLYAGKLNDFEKEATKDTPEPATRSSSTDSDEGDDSFSEFLIGVIFYTFAYGGISSWERMKLNSSVIETRILGEPGLPILRFDTSYQDVESDVYAIDNRLEVGYGPFGCDYRITKYHESTPKTNLDITSVHGIYRMSFTRFVEVGLGLGNMTLEGINKHSGFSVLIPLHIQFSDIWSFQFRSSWSALRNNDVSDYDFGIMYTRGFGSIRVGYRSVSSGNEQLKGPHIGFSAHF